MANEENLKPIRTLSREEAKKRGSAGGKAIKLNQEKKMEEIIESIEVKNKDGDCVSFTFLDGDEYKTIIDDDYQIDIKFKNKL